jgi:hypothetical protein
MHSWGGVKRLALASRLRAVNLLHSVAAVGVLLACFAVVLNVGPFAKAPKREVVQAGTLSYGPSVRELFRRAAAERTFGASSLVRFEAAMTAQPDTLPPAKEATDLSQRFTPFAEQAHVADAAAKGAEAQPIEPVEDANAALDANPAPDAKAAPDVKPVQEAEPQPAKPTRPHATLVGVWAPDTGACSVRDFQEGLLPTIINANGAWAGETFCVFKKKRETKSGWHVVADCSNQREHWTANVHLSVKNNRLTWTSKRGTQTYTRCAPGFLMTAAR